MFYVERLLTVQAMRLKTAKTREKGSLGETISMHENVVKLLYPILLSVFFFLEKSELKKVLATFRICRIRVEDLRNSFLE